MVMKKYVNVKMATNGLETIARRNLNVRMGGYGMQPMKDVSVHKIITGLGLCVNLNQLAAVGNTTTKIQTNANVQVIRNGME